MTFRRILVPFSGRLADEASLAWALALADPDHGHLDVVHVQPDPGEVVAYVEAYCGATISGDMIAAVTRSTSEAVGSAQRRFEAWRLSHGLAEAAPASGTRGVTCRWQSRTGSLQAEIGRIGRCVDAIVMRHASKHTASMAAQVLEAALLGTGRPVLLVPVEARPAPIRRAIVAWNDRIESARAVAAALPLLLQAGSVVVFTAGLEKDGSGGDLSDLWSFFASHGIATETTQHVAPREAVGDLLLSEARRSGADVLVMGAYGHRRTNEKVFGSVTQYVIDHTEMPVMLAH